MVFEVREKNWGIKFHIMNSKLLMTKYKTQISIKSKDEQLSEGIQ